METTEQDCQSVLDLLNEHCHNNATMKVRSVQRGRANPDRKRFTIPAWALTKGEIYAFYYVIHEFTHIHFNDYGHGRLFKKHEDKLLDLFGIRIERAKIYPSRLYANGECQYTKTKS